MNIEDGTGKGYKAEVDNENRLKTCAICKEQSLHVNEEFKEMYSIVIDQTTATTDKQFYYLKNTSDDNMFITKIKGFVSINTEIYVKLDVSGTATSPTTVTPVNRNSGSANTATCTSQKGAALALTGGDEVDRMCISSTSTTQDMVEWKSALILRKNQTLVLVSSAASVINMTLSVYFRG